MTRRWLFADQLGPHFLATPDQPVLLVESTGVLARRRYHRQKAHYVLAGLRSRARELGEQAVYRIAPTYGEMVRERGEELEVPTPTSRAAEALVARLPGVTVVPSPYTATSREDFLRWTAGRKRLLLEDFYRWQRVRHEILVEGSEPVGGTWNLDHDNREPPPRTGRLDVVEPWWPVETDVDAEVREHLDRLERDGLAEFRGVDGPRRFAVTREEALAALGWFIRHRLAAFGPHEDAMLKEDWAMAHSTLSPALNLGLLQPIEVVTAAEAAYRRGDAPLNSVEGFVRQVLGWREYVWGVYWWAGESYRERNALAARTPLPQWFWDLDAEHVEAACLSDVLAGVRDRGWVHHIPRLMVLGNWALQRGYDPAELADWFHWSFLDGYGWVMAANVIGMSQHADGGLMATKPYASGGAYINRMSDYCAGCAYDPAVRVGDDACPFTAGYWWFLDRNAARLAGNHRMARALAGRHRLRDLPQLLEQETHRGDAPP